MAALRVAPDPVGPPSASQDDAQIHLPHPCAAFADAYFTKMIEGPHPFAGKLRDLTLVSAGPDEFSMRWYLANAEGRENDQPGAGSQLTVAVTAVRRYHEVRTVGQGEIVKSDAVTVTLTFDVGGGEVSGVLAVRSDLGVDVGLVCKTSWIRTIKVETLPDGHKATISLL